MSSADGGVDDERARSGRAKWWRRLRKSVLGAASVLLVGGGAAFGIGYLVLPIPDPVMIASTDQSVLITYSDGTEMTRIVPSSGHRIMVDDLRGEVSEAMRDATLAAEDISFYENQGFDVTGILRAAWSQVTGGVGGGSTLTQQYVKMATGADEHSYFRKFKEVVLALKVTNERSKDEIFKAYLNIAYYGRGAYGVGAAAEAYFGKLPADLDPSESALLAGMVQRPTQNDPAYNPEQGRARWDYVAGQMRGHGLVDEAETAAMRLPLTRERFAWRGAGVTGPAFEIKQRALEEAESMGFIENTLQRHGYTVVTTVDPSAQRAAEQAVAPVHSDVPGSHAALVAIEPGTGAVRAYDSGSTTASGYDWADAPQHPGTAFAPFDPFLRLATLRDTGPTVSPGSRGDPSLVREAASRLGFSSRSWEGAAPGESAEAFFDRVLAGEQPVSAMDVAHAYATIAADGQERAPRFLSKILDKDGHEVFSAGSPPEPAFSADVDSSTRLARKTAAELWPELGRPASAVPRAPVVDMGNYHSMTAWTNGFTPRLATSIVLSASDEQDRARPLLDSEGRPLDGTAVTGGIWQSFSPGSGSGARTAD